MLVTQNEKVIENINKMEFSQKKLRDENNKMKYDLEHFKSNVNDSMMNNSRSEVENERLKNKLKSAHNDLRRKLDEHLLD